ncbi:FtsX-like permease family protein [Atopobium fossor]|uniref:FtsX-like permease family protein n=1 Tax=Atopobium fossor TaxID=39487 RepID=UPI0003F6E5AB|nr:ABC transporter permease [Atopobium fossor]
MLAKLAFRNVRRSARDYLVYFFTLTIGVAVFYAFNTIAVQADFLKNDVREMVREIHGIVTGLTIFLAIITGFLMVYANNFLMRHRKKELGLYQVLGMPRSMVARTITLETMLVAFAALVIGFAVGALLSQILLFVTAALFGSKVDEFKFFFSSTAFAITLGCFAVIFFIMVLFNLRSLRKVALVELMSAQKKAEKTRVKSLFFSSMVFLIGVVCVGVAYWRLVTLGFPGFGGTGTGVDFLITTVLVSVGTLVLFYGLAGALVALAQRSKKFYFSGLHSFSVREVSSQVNTNAISMGFVSLILFLAITSVTTGMSITNALKAAQKVALPFDVTIQVYAGSEDSAEVLATAPERLKAAGYDLASLGQTSTMLLRLPQDWDSQNTSNQSLSLGGFVQAGHSKMPAGFESSDAAAYALESMSIDDYNALRKMVGLDAVSLASDEYIVTSNMEAIIPIYKAAVKENHNIDIAGVTLKPSSFGVVTDTSANLMNFTMASNTGTLVVPNEVAKKLVPRKFLLNLTYDQGKQAAGDELLKQIDDLDDQTMSQLMYGNSDFGTAGIQVLTRTEMANASQGLRGLVTYLALYIGFVLVVICAAILAIQRLSATSDSAARYRTLNDLGASEKDMLHSLLFQTSLSFVAPLLVGMAHSVCALSVLIEIVRVLGGVNIATDSLLMVAIFVVIYGSYMGLTYGMSRRMVLNALGTKRHSL